MLESKLSTMQQMYRQIINYQTNSIQRDGSLVQPSSRRWQHSLGNALWHTVRTYLLLSQILHSPRGRTRLITSNEQSTHFCYHMARLLQESRGLILQTLGRLMPTSPSLRRTKLRI